jgi:hypothetical protein
LISITDFDHGTRFANNFGAENDAKAIARKMNISSGIVCLTHCGSTLAVAFCKISGQYHGLPVSP